MDSDNSPFLPDRHTWERSERTRRAIENILHRAGYPATNTAIRLEDRVAMLADAYAAMLSRVAGQTSAQRIVFSHIAQRGYVDGWTPAQFAARQVVKLAEELAELSAHINLPTDPPGGEFYRALQTAGNHARTLFDSSRRDMWDVAAVFHPQAEAEAADVLVVLFCLAESIGMLDISEDAINKARGDITRGVRG